MASRPVQVNLTAEDELALGAFWAAALGWESESEAPGVINLLPAGLAWPSPDALTMDLVRVPEGDPVRYRSHLDLATRSLEHQARWVRELLALGARRIDVGQGEVPWEVLADPEGNVFCVLEPRPGYATTGPIAAVVTECSDVAGLKAFYAAATDWVLVDDEEDFVSFRSPSGVGPFVEFLQVPEPGRFPTRLHLDLKAYPGSSAREEAARLEALGARPTDTAPAGASWVTLLDPEGNEFCVLAEG